MHERKLTCGKSDIYIALPAMINTVYVVGVRGGKIFFYDPEQETTFRRIDFLPTAGERVLDYLPAWKRPDELPPWFGADPETREANYFLYQVGAFGVRLDNFREVSMATGEGDIRRLPLYAIRQIACRGEEATAAYLGDIVRSPTSNAAEHNRKNTDMVVNGLKIAFFRGGIRAAV